MPDREYERLSRVYADYADSAAKQRAWSAQNPGNVAIRAELEDAVLDVLGPGLGGARKLLDAGCGAGWWLARLADHASPGAALHGIDLLGGRAAAAQARVPRAAVRTGDLRALPYADGAFDAVFLWTALSSMPGSADVARALAEAVRVLAPGGTIFVWEPRLPNPRNRSLTFVGRGVLRETLGPALQARTLTVLPPLARRLGPHTATLYPRLARVPALRSHRLVWARRR